MFTNTNAGRRGSVLGFANIRTHLIREALSTAENGGSTFAFPPIYNLLYSRGGRGDRGGCAGEEMPTHTFLLESW